MRLIGSTTDREGDKMLADFPILFNNTAIPNPNSYSESSEVVDKVNETEAGTDVVIIVRKDKLTASLSFNCSSYWAKKFAEYRDTEPLSVSMYDTKTGAYKTRSMRIRSYKSNLVENSWRSRRTNGLYEISFDLKEY